jgi:nucleotide-binding universal stress UspA family protein
VARPSTRIRRHHSIVADSSAPQFRRAVVALSGGRTDRRIVSLAADLARAGQAELVGVHVVEIDWTLPLDADVAGHDEDAQRVLDIAEATAEAAHFEMDTVLLQARDVGAAIVDEATEREADLIICGLPFRRRFGGEFAVGRTIPYILRNAPCGVWVIREAMPEEQA